MMGKEAKVNFKDRVKKWAADLEVDVTAVAIRQMRTKWASWSTSGRMTFDATLLELSPDLQAYVIVHELLHAHVPNHGRLWKSLMRAHLGKYETAERELREIAAGKPAVSIGRK